ncbi:hypothetical protein HYH03_000177 [Edaphochlamys debaryana]|uniref:Uncharacterized protein n=1 Tax=Edaphochlamys debaryana TaxID=47281 RepID=A0A835YH42_9CHLO|nr:hypothetical protein HYH03_000177 [Edaphochlamys debaryana]|eukprot:KAG2501674.1 hypothetical protein HYH03_000177 [Edaphochlamys debaryana]
MVCCSCSTCASRPASRLLSAGGRTCSLEDWFLHAAGVPAAWERLLVRQPGADYQVPFGAWLHAAAHHMGGERLLRKQLSVYYWDSALAGEAPAPTLPRLPYEPPPEPAPRTGVWRAGTVVGWDPVTCTHVLKYHNAPKKATHRIYLPLTVVHFARTLPPGGTPRNVFEGCTPLPPILLPPSALSVPLPAPAQAPAPRPALPEVPPSLRLAASPLGRAPSSPPQPQPPSPMAPSVAPPQSSLMQDLARLHLARAGLTPAGSPPAAAGAADPAAAAPLMPAAVWGERYPLPAFAPSAAAAGPSYGSADGQDLCGPACEMAMSIYPALPSAPCSSDSACAPSFPAAVAAAYPAPPAIFTAAAPAAAPAYASCWQASSVAWKAQAQPLKPPRLLQPAFGTSCNTRAESYNGCVVPSYTSMQRAASSFDGASVVPYPSAGLSYNGCACPGSRTSFEASALIPLPAEQPWSPYDTASLCDGPGIGSGPDSAQSAAFHLPPAPTSSDGLAAPFVGSLVSPMLRHAHRAHLHHHAPRAPSSIAAWDAVGAELHLGPAVPSPSLRPVSALAPSCSSLATAAAHAASSPCCSFSGAYASGNGGGGGPSLVDDAACCGVSDRLPAKRSWADVELGHVGPNVRASSLSLLDEPAAKARSERASSAGGLSLSRLVPCAAADEALLAQLLAWQEGSDGEEGEGMF